MATSSPVMMWTPGVRSGMEGTEENVRKEKEKTKEVSGKHTMFFYGALRIGMSERNTDVHTGAVYLL